MTSDIVQQAKQSETDELQIAMATKSADALETYLEKYPETLKRGEVLREIGNLRRTDYSEWTIYEWSTAGIPQYMRLNSIQQFGDKAVAEVKYLIENPETKKLTDEKVTPAGAYQVDLSVFDCKKLWVALAEKTVYSKSGDVLYHFKWGDPRYLNLAIGFALTETSIGARARKSLHVMKRIRLFLASKRQLSLNQKFDSLASTVSGDGDIFYRIIPRGQSTILRREGGTHLF